MTDDERAALVAEVQLRAEAATPGPWESYNGNEREYAPLWSIANDVFHNPNDYEDEASWIDVHIDGSYQGEADAEFISHARTDIPALLAIIEADGKLIARVPEEVHAERARQVKAEGYSAEHDRGHEAELLRAAACYMEAARLADAGAGLYEWQHKPPLGWPWRREFWKPASARRMRVKAGALMLAAQDAWKAEYDAAKGAGL